MRWYIPSWNGDIRFQMDLNDPERTLVTIIQPTPGEIAKLRKLTEAFKEKEWITRALWNSGGSMKEQVVYVNAPILDVAPYLVASYKPGKAVLTALKYEDGEVKAVEQKPGFWSAIKEMVGADTSRVVKKTEDDEEVRKVMKDHEKDAAMRAEAERKKEAGDNGNGSPHREPAKEKEKPKPKPKAATTVARPSICCPQCVAGDLTPAGEVLYEFLTEDEKRQWEKDHSIVVYGGITGYPYLLSHRHGKWAIRHGKICRDLQYEVTLHFHDNSVPPEEEVLAAKLILEHREHWLRTAGTGAHDGLP
ncbi:MAG: hypothetical protein KAJ19_15260, partial [Gammaproteobacteria bacterium]|nr:hypothetical protein [Gammaproteobacteria bacterium]